MKLPPLLRERPLAVQVILAVVAPIGFGALCGYMLGRSEPVFNLLMLIAGIGGVLAGFEHLGARAGVGRGLVGGVLFTGALIGCFTLRDLPALARLPLPLHSMAVIYAAMGMPIGALGGRLRQRTETRRAGAAVG